jgi:hypothetical protein
MLTIESTLHLVRTSDTKIRSVYSRPYLCALLWYDGEAYLLLAELHPRERAERIERRCKLYTVSAAISRMRHVYLLVKVVMFCIDALKRIFALSSHNADGMSRRVEKCGGESRPSERHRCCFTNAIISIIIIITSSSIIVIAD